MAFEEPMVTRTLSPDNPGRLPQFVRLYPRDVYRNVDQGGGKVQLGQGRADDVAETGDS